MAPHTPTRREVAAALVTTCDILLATDAVNADAEMPTKLRAVKNYADTLFSGDDCNKIRSALSDRPDLLRALRANDIDAVCSNLEQSAEGGLHYALSCISTVHPTLREDDVTALWSEIELICDLVE